MGGGRFELKQSPLHVPNYITNCHTGFLVSRVNLQNSQLPPVSHIQPSNAQGLPMLRSQVNRRPGFLELILFLCNRANLCLKRSAGSSELLWDLIFSVNEACFEWKGFLTAQQLSQPSINPTDSSTGLHLLLRCKVFLHQALREQRVAVA